MRSTRVPLLIALVVLSLCAVPVSAAGGVVAPSLETETDYTASATTASTLDRPATTAIQDRDDDPSTEETIGYVEGYWHDDDLPVDDRDDAVVEDDELQAVVYRSMARVEVIRERTFNDEVPVDVISREEFQERQDNVFFEPGPTEQLQENVNYEALFMVDRETNAVDETETLYAGAVEGYYEPTTNQIVLVSNSPEAPELNEGILGHELVHALQDQQFNLTSYERETIDGNTAKNGLIEGDAVAVETEYDQRCGTEWECTEPANGAPDVPSDVNWGIYFSIYQPYDDGPDYIEHLREQGGWEAVDDAYDDPPASTSEVIHPGEDREPAEIEVEDRSSDDWDQLEIGGEPATETVGEAAMVSMLADGAIDPSQPSVISRNEFLELGPARLEEIHYDQPYTDGWAGDELVTYVSDGVNETDEPTAAAADAGYVWESEWQSPEDAQEFVDGYLQLLDINGADPVDDRQDTYEIDDDFPGAYYVDVDGETVTIVNAPSIDALDAIDANAAPSGEDTLAANESSDDADADGSADDADSEESADDTTTDEGTDGTDSEESVDEDDSIAGFGVVTALVSLLLATVAVRRSHGRRP